MKSNWRLLFCSISFTNFWKSYKYFAGRFIYDLIEEKDRLSFDFVFNNEEVFYYTYLSKIDVRKTNLLVVGYTDKLNLPDQVYYGDVYSFKWNPKLGFLELNVQLQEGFLSSGKRCLYLNKGDFSFSFNIIDKSDYNVPIDILILKEDKTLVIENIKNLVKELVRKISLSL